MPLSKVTCVLAHAQVILQVSVAVLLDNFVAASSRLEAEVKEERIKVGAE